MAKRKLASAALVPVGIAFLLTTLGCMVGDNSLALVISPIVLLLVFYAMWQVPMRHSLMALMFLVLFLQDPSDNPGLEGFAPPYAAVGKILLLQVKHSAYELGIPWATFTVMDLILVMLLVIARYRIATKSKIDAFERVPTPRPLIQLMKLAFAGIAWAWLVGMVTGGDFGKTLWQINRVVYLPFIFYLFQQGLRGPKDLEPLLKVVLVTATYKALLALYVVFTFELPPDPITGSTRPAVATGHADSVLFSVAFATVLILVFERVGGLKRALKLAVPLIPILAGGIWANNRRTAWVQVAATGLTAYLLTSKENPVKKKIKRALVLLAPVAALYVMVGWDSPSRIFKPVKTLRSVVEPDSDGSTNWRELENFNLINTAKANPVFGTGYGHGFIEFIVLPHVPYELERFCPHNSVLGVFAYSGALGWTTLTTLWVVAVYFAVRSYHATRDPTLRAGALSCVGVVVVHLLQCWGDMGIGMFIGVFLVCPAIAMAGKLAVVTGECDPSRKLSWPWAAQPLSRG